jgi:peptide/nickel transport system ATP-binding protein
MELEISWIPSFDGDDTMTISDNLVLHVKDLYVNFYTYEGVVKALDGVIMFLRKGDTMGVVGETGCGKSVTAKAVLRLVEAPGKIEDGQVLFYDKDEESQEIVELDLVQLQPEEMLEVRGNKISIVFQDPATYPNPVFRIGDQIAEVIELHQDQSLDVLYMKIAKLELALSEAASDENRAEIESKIAYYREQLDDPPEPDKKSRKEAAKQKAIEMLRLVRMPAPEQVVNQYPHELSGGMRQRALIAMSLACNPSILICDEATTALDVTVQAQVLKLLNQLKEEIGTSIIVITHDMGVVAETCNWVNVMYAGTTVESCATDQLFARPFHPYTAGLLTAVPKLHEEKERLPQIRGSVPNLITPPPGCRFHPRCDYATDVCKEKKPLLEELEPGHWVSCHHPLID